MGSISRWPLKQWRKRYDLRVFVETGTWRGDGLMAALGAEFLVAFSVELHPEQALSAEARVSQAYPDRSWNIIVADSQVALPELLCILNRRPIANGPVLWWLDAHLPERYQGTGEGARTPLEAELRAIVNSSRDHSRDVFVMDDMRLYRRDAWANGDFPGPLVGDIADLVKLLQPTHICQIKHWDEGYLVALPECRHT